MMVLPEASEPFAAVMYIRLKGIHAARTPDVEVKIEILVHNGEAARACRTTITSGCSVQPVPKSPMGLHIMRHPNFY